MVPKFEMCLTEEWNYFAAAKVQIQMPIICQAFLITGPSYEHRFSSKSNYFVNKPWAQDPATYKKSL